MCNDTLNILAAEAPTIDELDINRALDQPTWQDSQYSSYESSYAADGNFNPNLDENSCAMQNNIPKGWWAVDLSDSYQIDRVTLTNAVSHRKYGI